MIVLDFALERNAQRVVTGIVGALAYKVQPIFKSTQQLLCIVPWYIAMVPTAEQMQPTLNICLIESSLLDVTI